MHLALKAIEKPHSKLLFKLGTMNKFNSYLGDFTKVHFSGNNYHVFPYLFYLIRNCYHRNKLSVK